MGDDWAEDHHDVHLMDESGERLAARRLPEGVAGVTVLHELVAQHAAGPGEVVIGIETDRGPWVSALVAAGYHVYAINPRSASRYRERHHVGGAKSDAGDARLLADLVRTDRHNHREVAGDSDEAGAVRILARTHQQLIWDRVRQTNRLRNALREYFPGALEAIPKLAHGDAVGVLSSAPGPREAARLSISQIRSALRRGGRQRSIERRAAAVREALRSPQLEAPPAVSKAFAASTRAAVGQISEINRQIKELERPSSRPLLSSTRTPASTVPCPVSVWSSAPGCSRGDPERYDSEVPQALRRYLAADGSIRPQAHREGSASSATGGSTPPPTSGRCARCRRARAAVTSTTGGAAAGDLHHQALVALANRYPVGYLHCCRAACWLRRDDRLGTPLHPP